MNGNESNLTRLREWIHHYFLALLIGAYLLASFWPGPGETIRKTSIAVDSFNISLPMVLLAILLFNAGIGADILELRAILWRPKALVVGVVANVLVPIAFLMLLAQGLRSWPDPDEAQCLLVGLAVVAAMPVAGSSTAWSQNSNGSAALSLGLVVLSTLLSPFTTPLTLAAIEPLTDGNYAMALEQLCGNETGTFLLGCVVFPSLAGMVCRCFLGRKVLHIKPAIKLMNSLVLLVLCYANASSVLPKIAAEPDWDFLLLCVTSVAFLCLAAFGTGWAVARLLKSSESQKRSLVFALGMNNNGTGIVLACSALAGMPGAVLPVLAYNLVQHLVAGGVHRRIGSGRGNV